MTAARETSGIDGVYGLVRAWGMLGEKERWWEDGKGAEGVGRTMRKKRTILRDSGQPVGLKSGVVLLQLPSKIRITFQRRNIPKSQCIRQPNEQIGTNRRRSKRSERAGIGVERPEWQQQYLGVTKGGGPWMGREPAAS